MDGQAFAGTLQRVRDRRLRRRLLTTIFELRTGRSGWASAELLRDVVNDVSPPDEGFETDQHCLGLLRDLEIKGLIQERQTKSRKGEKFGLGHLQYRILGLGISLENESVPPDPDIYDDRIT